MLFTSTVGISPTTQQSILLRNRHGHILPTMHVRNSASQGIAAKDY